MQRGTQIQLIATGILLACIATSAVVATHLSAVAGQSQLTYADRAEEGDPPQVAAGIAMGAFRGLFVNFLWIRANELKEQGRYYEAIDLASAITKLQPRFPRVWVFHAWNMAYNISVAVKTARERWEWVQAGIRLLRDEGLAANPNDLLIHKELAWIYLHKIQGFTDDSNVYYKNRLAVKWHAALGAPPHPDPLDLSRERAKQKFVDWLTPIAEAPVRLQDLTKDRPDIAQLVKEIEELEYEVPGKRVVETYAQLDALRSSGNRELWSGVYDLEGKIAFLDLMENAEYAAAWEGLMPFLRARLVIDEYKMEPFRMIRYTRKYGPIDWRHPAAHGLYWSARGVEEALERVRERTRTDFDFTNTDRVVVQSVQELRRSGEVYLDPLAGEVLQMPNAHFTETYGEIIDEIFDRSLFETARRAYSSLITGYENFMEDAIRFYYRRGQIELAEEYRTKLLSFDLQNTNDLMRNIELSQPIDEWVQQQLFDRYKSPQVARDEIDASLQQAYVSGLLAGSSDIFDRSFKYAADFHRYYMEQQRRENVTTSASRVDVFPPDFRYYAGITFYQLISKLSLDNAEAMYAKAPDDLKRYAYDSMERRFREALSAQGEVGGRSFEVVFPEPAGMESFRERMRQRAAQRDAGTPNVAPR